MTVKPPLSATDWKSLPEIAMPVLKDETRKGSVYKVYKVGFVLANSLDCKEIGVRTSEKISGKCLLPTAVVEFENQQKMCRLPISLSEWVISTVGMAHSGTNLLPSYVEFGAIHGRNYAEIVEPFEGA